MKIEHKKLLQDCWDKLDEGTALMNATVAKAKSENRPFSQEERNAINKVARESELLQWQVNEVKIFKEQKPIIKAHRL